MMIVHRQQLFGLALQPAGAGQGLALGTVAVATRVVGQALMAAVEAALDMPTQRRCATHRQIPQGFALRVRQRVSVLRQERLPVVANHLRHFQRRPLGADAPHHGRPSTLRGAAPVAVSTGRATTSPSSNCGNCCSRRMLTCRYFAVVWKWLWPKSACTESRSTPASNKWVAKLWRKVWGWTRFVSAARRAVRLQIRCTVPSVRANAGLTPGNSQVVGRYSRQ